MTWHRTDRYVKSHTLARAFVVLTKCRVTLRASRQRSGVLSSSQRACPMRATLLESRTSEPTSRKPAQLAGWAKCFVCWTVCIASPSALLTRDPCTPQQSSPSHKGKRKNTDNKSHSLWSCKYYSELWCVDADSWYQPILCKRIGIGPIKLILWWRKTIASSTVSIGANFYTHVTSSSVEIAIYFCIFQAAGLKRWNHYWYWVCSSIYY